MTHASLAGITTGNIFACARSMWWVRVTVVSVANPPPASIGASSASTFATTAAGSVKTAANPVVFGCLFGPVISFSSSPPLYGIDDCGNYAVTLEGGQE